MTDEKVKGFADLCRLSAENNTLKNFVLSSPLEKEVQKIKGTVRKFSEKTVVQLEYFCTEGRVRQENVEISELSEVISERFSRFSRADLNDSAGSASLMRSKKGKVSLVKHGTIGGGERVEARGDKVKNYILDGSEEFLFHLGISDKGGRVHDKKQSKYRQINRFLEYVGDMMKYLPREGELRVADLCCGKSYLSFAVYYYLTKKLSRAVSMDCMDLKESVMEYCADIARKCGFDGMHFASGDVTKYEPAEKPHLVISLHACDIATDIVLERACSLGAEVILSTPCCHRQLSRELDCEPLRFVSASSVLKSKMCDALTDSLRVLRLEAEGYSADAVELIDPEDTPKNVLIRAHKNRNLSYGSKSADEYKLAYKFLTGKDAPALSKERQENNG
ncbi:MAG: SAM-dependent methyltransferase [Ruminococcaceae bacterium]|nr:SAM-dependent methyltransferase [Oscillospiraceae bacterium]